MTNLVGRADFKARIDGMSTMLDAWMKAQGDTVRLEYEPYPLSGPTPHELKSVRRPPKK